MVDKDKLQLYLKRYGPLIGLKTYIHESIFLWQNEKIHIAFVGETGVGKSSLVNALRNIPDYHEDAAKVDVKTVQHELLKPYTLPNNDRVFLWDLPGVGSRYEPVTDILRSLKVEKFEVVVIVLSTRFKDINLEFAKECIKLGCFVILVRTKIDQDVRNDARARNIQDNEKECLEIIRDDIHNGIVLFQTKHKHEQNTLTNVDIFLVSSHEIDAYDFQRLSSTLEKLVSQRAKRIREQLECPVLTRIEVERVINNERFLRRKLFAAMYDFLPKKLKTSRRNESIQIMLQKSKRKFGLDDKTLKDFHLDMEPHKDDFKLTYATLEDFLLKQEAHKDDFELTYAHEQSGGSSLRLKVENVQHICMKCKKKIQSEGSAKVIRMALSDISETLAKDLKDVVRRRLNALEEDLTQSLQFNAQSLGSDLGGKLKQQ